MDWELVFWIVGLVIGLILTVRALVELKDLYYEGRLDKIGGKGGRQVSQVRPGELFFQKVLTFCNLCDILNLQKEKGTDKNGKGNLLRYGRHNRQLLWC